MIGVFVLSTQSKVSQRNKMLVGEIACRAVKIAGDLQLHKLIKWRVLLCADTTQSR